LLVYTEYEPLHTFRVALASQGIGTWRARSCQHARTFLAKFKPVHVIFTDMNLPDGTWRDLVRAKGQTAVPLIVVAQEMDVRLWSEVVRHGGVGLIVPSFAASDLSHPVRGSRPRYLSKQGSLQNGNFDLVSSHPYRLLLSPEEKPNGLERLRGRLPLAIFDPKQNSHVKGGKTL
jgi:hypothetical protein